MYNTSQNYKNYIKEPSRMFESKIILGSRTLNNDDVIQLKTELQQPSNGFTLGSCISKSLELTLNNDGGAYASVGIVNVSLGLKMGELIEYIPQGIFNIDKVEKTDYTVKVTAYDNMIKFETAYSEKYDNPTLKQVIQQLQDITGVEFDSSVTIPSYTLNKLSGYTCREILGYVASLMGGNAYITREGKLTIVTPVEVDYTVTSNNYWDYDLEDNTYKIGMLTCQNKLKNDAVDESDDYEAIEEKNTISAGSLGSDNMELTFVNPWMTETILNTVYNKLKSFSFLGYSMKWQGDLSLDVGNIINVIDKHGVTRKAFMFSDKINYNGGLTQETGAKGQTKSSNQFSTVDSPTELDRISVKVLLAEKAIIQKANIADLTAVSAKVGTLDVSIATINTALINKANIDDLNATNANVTNLNAQYANLSNAIINKADIADLNATNANISNLKATVADISTLVSGNLTSANIHSLVLTADKVTVQSGFIKNAMVESLVADKITSGTLNTNKLNIASNDGGLVLANNTIQFSDKDKNVRVQIGQDTKGDFNFIVKGTDGRTVLLDSTGLHEGAISDGLIKTDMIADNSINSNKIDYSSVISGLNADGSNYINASKVAIDLTGQTLDIAFNSVKTIADSANDKIDNLNVGGVNLFTGTKDFSGTWKDKSFWTIDGTKYKNFVVMKSSNQWMGLSQFVPFVKGEKYVLSAYVKCDTGAGVYFYSSEGSVVPSTDNGTKLIGATDDATSWRKIYQAFTITSDGSFRPRFENSVDGKMFYICGLKLEKGNIATDWTPAPEDIENSISDVKSITETNTTSISAIQGQISTLISNTTVTVDGKEKTLKDAYSGTVQTVNSINTTIGEHTSTINTLNGTVSSNSSKITSIQTDLNGVKTSVSSVQSDLNSTKSQLSSLSTTLDGFESRVETTESTLNNLSVGGKNLLLNSDNGYLDDLGIFDFLSVTYSITDDGWKRMLISNQLSNREIVQNKWVKISEIGYYTESIYVRTDGMITSASFSFFTSSGHDYAVATIKSCGNGVYRLYASKNINVLDKNIRVVDLARVTTINATYLDFKYPKFEKGSIPTDWTPAPEDVESYTDTQIASAKSEIKQTTDSISQSVSNINSSITTINNTLGNKAEKSTVESISNSVISLNTTLNGITGRVSTLETSTTTLTTKMNDLSIGGRNLLITSNAYKGYWLNSRGELQNNSTTDVMRDYISVTPSEVLTFQKENSEEYFRYNWYDVNKNYISREPNRNNLFKFTVPQNAYYLWVSYPNTGKVKIEKGSIPTDWTPAPEDVENEITTVQETVTSNTTEISALKNSISLKVDSTTLNSYKDTVNGQINTINSSISSMQSSIDLQLGSITSSVSQLKGDNLLKNSSFEQNYNGWGIRNNSTYFSLAIDSDNTFNESNSLRVGCTAVGGSNYNELAISLKQSLSVSTTYIISFYAKAKSEMTLYFRAGYGSYVTTKGITVGTEWKQYSTTITTSSSNADAYIYWYLGSIGTLYINSPRVTGNTIGTIITQSPTEVMTAFNGISKYFEVSSGGAKFGNIATGDYTSMNDKGLIHHVGGSEYEYVYLTYTQPITAVLVNSSDWQYFTIEYQDTLKTLLNGRIPKQIIFSGADTSPDDTSSYFEVYCKTYVIVTEITANNFTVKIKGRSRLVAPSYTVSNNQIFLKFKTYYGGLFSADAIIIA
ncbi:carbohydrate binding domain-containing protein [Clostridium butyricum]|uniref:carbohydrate binding domain-containing protein n=1 Tax=Clostridium butyricum TaxID=1492 RepID=UPI0034656366